MAETTAETSNPSSDDIVVRAAKPAKQEWGYNLDVFTFNDHTLADTYRIKDKNEKLELPSHPGWVEVSIPKDAKLELTGPQDRSNFMTLNAEAGAKLNVTAGTGQDYIKPSIQPAANTEELKHYKTNQVNIDGGSGQDAVAVPGDTIITRLADDKNGQAYRFTDKNGYAFNATNVENVVNTTSQTETPQQPSNRKGADLPSASVHGTELNTLGLKQGESMTTAEATRTMYDPRVKPAQAEIAKAEDEYSAKLAACYSQAKASGAIPDCKADMREVNISDFGAVPAHEKHLGALPTPTITSNKPAPQETKVAAR